MSGTSEALKKAHVKMAELRATGWKPEHLDPVEKARRNPKSMKLAIRANCYLCMGGGSDAGVRIRVRDCSVTACMLRAFRPWQDAKGSISEEGVIEEIAGDDEDDENLEDTAE